jgi:hypothetical protein
MEIMSNRAAQAEIVDMLEPNPKLDGPASAIASATQDAYYEIRRILEDEAEAAVTESGQFTLGLQKLLEAKDCFVRVAVLASDD